MLQNGREGISLQRPCADMTPDSFSYGMQRNYGSYQATASAVPSDFKMIRGL